MFSIPFHCFFRTFISQIHPKGSTPHILLFSKSWSQISVLLIKIGKTKFPNHHLMAHAPPRVAKGFGLLIHAMSYLHASDLQPTATDSSAGHLHSINRKLLYPNPLRRRDTPSRSCRRFGSPIHAPLDLLTRTTRWFYCFATCRRMSGATLARWCHDDMSAYPFLFWFDSDQTRLIRSWLTRIQNLVHFFVLWVKKKHLKFKINKKFENWQ